MVLIAETVKIYNHKTKVYIVKTEDGYFSHALDFNLVAYGDTVGRAITAIIEQMKLYCDCVKEDIEAGIKGAKYKRPAPLKYYLLFYWYRNIKRIKWIIKNI